VLHRGEVRVRYPERGSVTLVRVLADDPEGGRIRFSWATAPQSGTVQPVGNGIARWTVAAGAGPRELRIRVEDRAGAVTERILVAPTVAELRIAGQVVDPDGRPIEGVRASLDGVTARSERSGRFLIRLPDGGQKRFVLNLLHSDHAPLSFVFAEPVARGRWVMSPATTATVSFAQPVSLAFRAAGASCRATLSSQADWRAHPKERIAATVTGGRAFSAAVPGELDAALRWIESPTACATGFSARFGPNAFVRAGTTTPVPSGRVSVSQVQIAAPGAMPGDYTVRVAGGGRRVMQSYGAGSVAVSSGGQPLALAPGQRATMWFPVDPGIVRRTAKLPGELPLLRYDETAGEWEVVGTARLNRERTAWAAEVDHLSTFNLDLLKTDQSCVRVDASAIADPSIDLEVTIPQDPLAPVVRTTTLDNATATLHALYNLPSNTWIALRPFRIDTGGTPTPLGTFVVNTGAPQVPTDPNQPAYPYDACQAEVALRDLGATIEIVNQDNEPTRSGMLVPVYFGLADPSTGDLYPAGSTDLPLLGIYDTGSNSIPISDSVPNRLTSASTSDADQLGVSGLVTVNLRVNPIDALLAGGAVPMGPPGAADAAAAELPSVLVRDNASVDLTLIGGPFHTRVTAYIDYGIALAIPGSGESGAWIRLFAPGAAGIPLPDIETTMERFGSGGTSPSGGHSIGPRFLLHGITLRHGSVVAGPSGPSSSPKVFYDSGTTWFTVSTTLGATLGLGDTTDVDYRGPCYTAGDLFRVDQVELAGAGGKYRVSDLLVCRVVDTDLPVIAAGGVRADAIVGSNMFRRMAVVVDGPNDKFGLLRP
jgi:hypothetical protein